MSATDDPVACACALAGLPAMGPRRLSTLIDTLGAAEAWRRLAEGSLALGGAPAAGHAVVDEGLLQRWTTLAAAVDPAAVLDRHAAAGIQVICRTDPEYPMVLADDVEAPAVLFALGDLTALGAIARSDHPGPPRRGGAPTAPSPHAAGAGVPRRVAIVGTRRCTGVGAGMARELGRELAAAGVVVVSGLALGIDGAAHRGVLDARRERAEVSQPVGVVGSGLDVVYPARHRDLWERVAQEGLLLSEAPLGARPEAWRFPARNRVIAALADVVVVVESHARGGSLHTVDEAARRDRPVLAVPGSVRSPAAAGTNQLLADGCHPVRDTSDVLVALGLSSGARRGPVEHRPAPDAAGAAILEAFDWEPATFEHLAARADLALPVLAVALEWLVSAGWVATAGGWYERVAAS